MNCVQCNKPFTCGCQKHSVGNGINVHKTCANDYNNTQGKSAQPNSEDLALALAQQKINDLRRKQDYALWLSILKSGHTSLPVDEVLAWYRQRKDSATSKKHKLIIKHYKFLINNENLNYFDAFYYTSCWICNGLKRYYI